MEQLFKLMDKLEKYQDNLVVLRQEIVNCEGDIIIELVKTGNTGCVTLNKSRLRKLLCGVVDGELPPPKQIYMKK